MMMWMAQIVSTCFFWAAMRWVDPPNWAAIRSTGTVGAQRLWRVVGKAQTSQFVSTRLRAAMQSVEPRNWMSASSSSVWLTEMKDSIPFGEMRWSLFRAAKR